MRRKLLLFGLLLLVLAGVAAGGYVYLLEAVVLSTLGGLCGAVVGIVGSKLVSALAAWPTIVAPEAVLVAILFSGAVGVFFGFYPACKAARLEPIQALRYE